MGTAGSAAHIHISVHQEGTERPAKGLSVQESSFLAGVLEHLPAIPAITLPTPASYKRVADGVWSGGTYVHYGAENREAPIRLMNATSPQSRNFEMRSIEGTANPHLALSTIIGAGLTGLKNKKKLEAFGITKRMALNIEQGEFGAG
uniref:GS catalytic domain-containing protein n=1 Tax=Moniliophthora roreri TaxID=221103 RepID=A0A0W0G2R2_MONRR